MIFTAHENADVDYDGTEIKEYNSKFDSPFIPGLCGEHLKSLCYVIYRGLFGKYKIKECYVSEIFFTNIWGWRMNNGWCFSASEFGKTVFRHDELQKAIEICEKKNRMSKVKIKYL